MLFVSLPGHRKAFLLPDRSKYVNMEKCFLRSYMDLLVQTCHQRGALATGGMAALLLPQDPLSDSHNRVLAAVTRYEHHFQHIQDTECSQCRQSKFTDGLKFLTFVVNSAIYAQHTEYRNDVSFRQQCW